jgi:WD40 repeat protein
VDANGFCIQTQFLAKGSGAIQSILVENDQLYIPSQNGMLYVYAMDGSLSTEYKIPSGSCYHIDWAKKENSSLWITMEGELHHYNLISKKDIDVSFHSLTCCGVDIDTDEKLVVSGDFLGNVILWDVNSHDRVAMISLYVSIRCICWKRNSIFVQIGCLDGTVWNWNTKTNDTVQICQLEGSVICMDWDKFENPTRLAIGTSNGFLEVFNEEFKSILSFQAHAPVDDHKNKDQFGSIHHFSEIWSLKWAPSNDKIATCSEDQTTRVWNLKGELLVELSGHTSAVTGVDWSVTSIGEFLITCADDKKVMVWDAITWKVHYEFISDVVEWHTLTYLSMEQDGSRLCVATQNGYVILYSLETKSVLSQKKFHNGSIEGLKWKKNHIVTCSSDCTVCLFNTSL